MYLTFYHLHFTVRNVVAARYSFHKHLWFCSKGGCLADTPLGRHPQAEKPLHRQTPPGQIPPGQTPPGQTPPRLLQRTVRILLECVYPHSTPGFDALRFTKTNVEFDTLRHYVLHFTNIPKRLTTWTLDWFYLEPRPSDSKRNI